MLFGLPRKTSKYIHSLQTWSVAHCAHDLVVPRVAVLLGALGIAMSGYSSHQLTLHHRPSTRILRWASRPVAVGEILDTQPGRANLGSANAAVASFKTDRQSYLVKHMGDTQQS